jgi:hypothetical protein
MDHTACNQLASSTICPPRVITPGCVRLVTWTILPVIIWPTLPPRPGTAARARRPRGVGGALTPRGCQIGYMGQNDGHMGHSGCHQLNVLIIHTPYSGCHSLVCQIGYNGPSGLSSSVLVFCDSHVFCIRQSGVLMHMKVPTLPGSPGASGESSG